MKDRRKGQKLSVSVSCATFVPKPFTPCQFEPQISPAEINRRQKLLLDAAKGKRYMTVSYHNFRVSVLEAALAKGDRRMGDVIYRAWQKGCKFDGWDECFRFDLWQGAFEESGLGMDFYARRAMDCGETAPWDHLDYMVSKEFLIREREKAYKGITTKNCREGCSGCGISKGIGRECFG